MSSELPKTLRFVNVKWAAGAFAAYAARQLLASAFRFSPRQVGHPRNAAGLLREVRQDGSPGYFSYAAPSVETSCRPT
jgi:hypothetical protein